jgi:hypothetical protein
MVSQSVDFGNDFRFGPAAGNLGGWAQDDGFVANID